MKIAIQELKKAIYDRVSANTSFRIYNGLPENVVYPAISFHIFNSENTSAKSCPGLIYLANFDCWSNAPNNDDTEVSEMMNAVTQSITVSQDSSPSMLSTTSFDVINQFVISTEIMHDLDGRTRHGVLTMAFWLFEK